jgi:ABC-type transport system involved in cytochrome c biogenesis ATPase subunit
MDGVLFKKRKIQAFKENTDIFLEYIGHLLGVKSPQFYNGSA